MKTYPRLLLLLCIGFWAITATNAAIKLPNLISDNMVLQRDVPVKIWGWANVGEKISVQCAGKKYTAITGTGCPAFGLRG